MSVDILHRWTQAVLYHSENAVDVRAALTSAVASGADLRGADLRGADVWGADLRDGDLRGADLRGADLRGADLWRADLRDADLRGADLRGADLRDADLRDADLRDAEGIVAERVTPLLLLLDQPGKIRAYKLVTAEGIGPYNGGITYKIGEHYEVADANTDPMQQCGAGINVAMLDWCLKEWKPGYRVVIIEFTAGDIACIPTATDGKFRLFRCDVVGEKDITTLVPPSVDAVST